MEGKRFVCWPESWRDAAVNAGLAERTEYGCIFSSDELRDKLAEFAYQIAMVSDDED